jgi:SAM-dependent methyltransferase
MTQTDFQKLLAAESPALHDEAAVEAALAALPPPRSPDMLLEKLLLLGVTQDDVVVDLGCGHGQYARQIAAAAGCTVVGLDMSQERVIETRGEARGAGSGRVHVGRAVAEALPLGDSAAGYIWARDMLYHVAPEGFGECARVLRPRGYMLAYQTFATELLEPREARRLFGGLNGGADRPPNVDPSHFEAVARGAGFAIIECDVVGSEWREWLEADGSRRTSASLLRAARLLRGAGLVRARAGDEEYEFALADQLWGVYQMIGKLEPRVYVLQRE